MGSVINLPRLSFFTELLQLFNCTNRKEINQALCTFQKLKIIYILIKRVEPFFVFKKQKRNRGQLDPTLETTQLTTCLQSY